MLKNIKIELNVSVFSFFTILYTFIEVKMRSYLLFALHLKFVSTSLRIFTKKCVSSINKSVFESFLAIHHLTYKLSMTLQQKIFKSFLICSSFVSFSDTILKSFLKSRTSFILRICPYHLRLLYSIVCTTFHFAYVFAHS